MCQRMTHVYCKHASVQVCTWEHLFMNTWHIDWNLWHVDLNLWCIDFWKKQQNRNSSYIQLHTGSTLRVQGTVIPNYLLWRYKSHIKVTHIDSKVPGIWTALFFIAHPYPIFIQLLCELGVNTERTSKDNHLVVREEREGPCSWTSKNAQGKETREVLMLVCWHQH